jgi:hypothetical protein
MPPVPALCLRIVGDFADPTLILDDRVFLAANPMSDRQMVIFQGPGVPVLSTPEAEPVSDVSQMSMFSAEDSPAKTCRWLDAAKVWLANGQDFSTSSCVSLISSLPAGFSSRTSLAFSRRTTDGTWESSWGSWPTSGMGGRTGCLTLNTSEWPNDADVCSLSDVLADAQTVPQRYFLSRKAATGILRRAEERGRELPVALSQALRSVADGVSGQTKQPQDI